MKYKLMTLSPIHIGNGEQISNWSYVGENGKVSVYSFEKIIKELKSDPKKLINLTSQIERNPLSKSLKEIISSFGIKTEPEYTVPLRGKLIKQRWDRNRHQNITEYKHIWEFIKENGKVYIPGSEIKGAIRTALFYKIMKDKFGEDTKLKRQFLKEYQECLDIDIRSFKNSRDIKKQIQKKFSNLEKRWESIVFRAGFDKVFDKEFQHEDAKKDILKILLISDTNLKQPEEILEVKDIKPIGVSRSFEELHEVVKAGSEFIIDLRIPFQDDYKKVFPVTYKYLGLKNLREACSDFALSLLESDIEYFKNTEELKPETRDKIIEKLRKRKNIALKAIQTKDPKKRYLLLRLGKHKGFLSTTINLLVKEFDPQLYSRAYEYLVHIGYSDNPNKSRKITIDNELLGWCVLIPAE